MADKPMWKHLFGAAESLTEHGYDSAAGRERVRAVLAEFVQQPPREVTAQR